MADNQADLVILGGGSGGYAAALRAAELGKSVVLIEKDKVGGTCLHRGCIPTKALLHAGEIADAARESAHFGVNATFEGIDMAGVNKYKDGVIGKNYKGLQGLIKSRGIEIVEGEGRLVGPQHRRRSATTPTPAPTSCWPPARTRARCPASRSTASGSSPASTPCSSTTCPAIGDRPRRRRHRRASSPAPGSRSAPRSPSSRRCRTSCRSRTRPTPSCSSAPSAAASIDFKLGARFERVEHTDTGVARPPRGRRDARGRAAARRGRPRPGRRQGSATRRRASRIERGFVVVDEYCRTSVDGVYAVGDLIHPDPAAGPRRLRRGHPGRRAHRRAAGRADRLRRRPAHHLLRARGRLGRPHRGRRPPRSTAPTTSRPSPTTCPATARARS